MIIEIKGRKYYAKSFDDLTGGDWRRIMLNFERAVALPDQFVPMMKSAAVIVLPAAAKDSRRWSDLDSIHAGAEAISHLARCLLEGADVMDRYKPAGMVLVARLNEIAEAVQRNGVEVHGKS